MSTSSIWKDAKLADGTILIPGVITQSSVLVEHPELIADRIEQFAQVVGRRGSASRVPTAASARLRAPRKSIRASCGQIRSAGRRRTVGERPALETKFDCCLVRRRHRND